MAKADLERITLYLIEEWGEKVAAEFLDRFDEVSVLVSKTPKIFPFALRKKQIRKAVLTFHNTIYFKEYEGFISFLIVFDTRQSLKKLKQKLK